MEDIAIYGFGSFFDKKIEFRDIDMLVRHQSTSYQSCQFSIWCKKYLLANVFNAHIIMLSKLEEGQLSFIEKSKARHLGDVNENSAKIDLDIILAREFEDTSQKKVS